MTLIDDWHEAYLKRYVVLLSPCLNVQLGRGWRSGLVIVNFTIDRRQVTMGKGKGVHVKGINFNFY